MKRAITIYLAILFISSDFVFSQAQTGNFTVTYNDRGTVSSIYFWVPTDYDSTKSYPFIMAWHGAGDTGGNMRSFMTSRLAQKINAILVCPDANIINGKDGTYFGNLTSAVYSHTLKNFHVDTSKIVIMGFSWGGAFSYQIGLLNPAFFKGIIGLAPAIGTLDATMWSNIKKIRMATILGDQDFNYAAVNALMNNIKKQGANLLYIVKPGVRHVDGAYFGSQAIIDDLRACYEYVISPDASDVAEETSDGNEQISIYPNPANLSISVNIISGEQIERIIIYSPEGMELINAQYNIFTDVSNLSPGVYYCLLKTATNSFVRKFVILR